MAESAPIDCSCVRWIRGLDIPGKVIILKCSICKTEYTLWPNGQIQFETMGSMSLRIGGVNG
jgi:hypothetical protein